MQPNKPNKTARFLRGIAGKLGIRPRDPEPLPAGPGLAEIMDRPPQAIADSTGRVHIAPIVRRPRKAGQRIPSVVGCYHVTSSLMGVRVIRADIRCPADMDAFMDGISLGYHIYQQRGQQVVVAGGEGGNNQEHGN